MRGLWSDLDIKFLSFKFSCSLRFCLKPQRHFSCELLRKGIADLSDRHRGIFHWKSSIFSTECLLLEASYHDSFRQLKSDIRAVKNAFMKHDNIFSLHFSSFSVKIQTHKPCRCLQSDSKGQRKQTYTGSQSFVRLFLQA